MKKIITSILAVTLMYSASAQISSGNILIGSGTDLSFSSTKLNSLEPGGMDGTSIKNNDLGFNVAGAYFVMDGLAVGLGIDYTSSKLIMEAGGSEVESTTKSMVIGPMIRYYIGETNVWGQLSYGIGTGSESYKSGGTTDETDDPKITAIGISAGYALFLNDNISLNPTLGYNMITSTEKDGTFDSQGNDADLVMKMGGISFGVSLAIHL